MRGARIPKRSSTPRRVARSCFVGSPAVAALALGFGWIGLAAAQTAAEAANGAGAASNLSFEQRDEDGGPAGWRVSGTAAVDDSIALEGERSLRITAERSGRDARAALRIPPPRSEGNRLRFAVHVKSEAAEDVVLSVRIDGPDGLLYIDRRAAAAVAGNGEWSRREIEAPVFDAATSVQLAVSIDAGTVWLDAVSIDGVSSTSLPPPSSVAARYVGYVLDLIDSHSIYRPVLDWPSFRAAVLDQARGAVTPADAHFAVRYAIGRLGDVHGYLRPADRAEALGRAPVSNARTGRPPISPDGRPLPSRVAYLTVPGFAGGSHMQQVEFAESLQGLIRSLDSADTCGFIVDLRRNSGGNLWPMLLGLGPLLGDGNAVFATYPDGRREAVWYRDGKAGLEDFARLRVRGEPYRVLGGDARVAILIGPDTASAGEVLAMAFRGLDGRRSFGAATDGVNTGTRTFVLADGAELVFAVVTMSDRTGLSYRGPMQPDEPVSPGPRDAPLTEQLEVRAALAWLGRGC